MKKLYLWLSIFLCAACTNLPKGERYDAIVSKTFYVSSIPQFNSLKAALAIAPADGEQPFRIFIRDGIYREKLVIDKNHIQLIGQSKSNTRILFNDYAGKLNAAGQMLTTYGSATLTIKATDIQLENLTLENDFDFIANDALSNDDPRRITGAQAVALYIEAPADKVLVRNIALLGYQDTLFINSGRSWFHKVLVTGNVDFIFGAGNALFTQSEIKTLGRGKPTSPQGFITAPSTHINSAYGFTFINCRLTRETSVPDDSVALGRPWHPTSNFNDGRYADPSAIGKAVFINSWMDSHILINGWYSMSGIAKEGGRQQFLPEGARFFEYKNVGPGARHNEKRRQLNNAQMADYAKAIVLGNWQRN